MCYEKITYKIREHSVAKIHVIAIVGAQEQESNTVTHRIDPDKLEVLSLSDLVAN